MTGLFPDTHKISAVQVVVLSAQGGLSASAAAMSVSAGFQDPDSRRRFRRFSLVRLAAHVS